MDMANVLKDPYLWVLIGFISISSCVIAWVCYAAVKELFTGFLNAECVWVEDENGDYQTACGGSLSVKKDLRYCPLCGKPVHIEPFVINYSMA